MSQLLNSLSESSKNMGLQRTKQLEYVFNDIMIFISVLSQFLQTAAYNLISYKFIII